MKQILFLALISTLSGCIVGPSVDSSSFLDQSCNALNRCPSGFECSNFSRIDSGIGTVCHPDVNPCSFISCPIGQHCGALESYPGQIICTN